MGDETEKMTLEEIQQYSHRIVKITITNANTQSSYDFVTIKISGDTFDVHSDETVRFGLNKNPSGQEWLAHQESEDDYFLRIPNQLDSEMYIYAHIFPSSLYEYEDDQQIFSIYDFSDFTKNNPVDQWYKRPYDLQIRGHGYEMLLTEDKKPLIRSLLKLKNTITYKDPNYKTYITSDKTQGVSDMTEKGRFPLSSKYRNSLYRQAPLFQDTRPPHWAFETPHLSSITGATPEVITNGLRYNYDNTATEINNSAYSSNALPYWEAKIHRSGLSPLISDNDESDIYNGPINVYLNYQYLPTSTEYHQHYFGFEGVNNIDGQQITADNTYEVLDGLGLEDIHPSFGVNPQTYRLIRHGNPFDTSNSMYISHDNIYDINLNTPQMSVQKCSWDKNPCTDYWTYTPEGAGSASIPITLEEDTYYVLKYFIYIPGYAYVENNSCYVEVRYGQTTIGELPIAFKNRDKLSRNEWIYHEIPFYVEKEKNNINIVIKGPQHNYNQKVGIKYSDGKIVNNPSTQDSTIYMHDCHNDVIHFCYMQIAEMVKYSPTLKYTNTGLYVVEGNKYANKPVTDDNSNQAVLADINKWDNTPENLTATGKWIKKGTKELPTPFTDVYISFADELNIIYDSGNSGKLSYTRTDYFDFQKFTPGDEELKWNSNDTIAQLLYDNTTTEYDTDLSHLFIGELKYFDNNRKVFTTGINNSFTLRLQDGNYSPVTSGKVECSIWKNNKEETTSVNDSEMYLGEQEPNNLGLVTYEKLNFKKLNPHETYYLRIVYTNTCYSKTITKWKRIFFDISYKNIYVYHNRFQKNPELLASSAYNNDDEKYIRTGTSYKVKSVNEFPLRLDVKITDQQGHIQDAGFCEISVNDTVVQSTFMDETGHADFFLDENELDPGQQIVKVEYYTRPYDAINFAYFVINCDTSEGYDERPAIPISVDLIYNQLQNQSDTQPIKQIGDNAYEIDRDGILFINIGAEGCSDFSVTVKKNNEKNTINIDDKIDEAYYITAEYQSNNTDTYTITTGNKKNEDGSDKTHKYRETTRQFSIKWRNNSNTSDITH